MKKQSNLSRPPKDTRNEQLSQADLARVRAYIQSVEWRFAKTMPQWPHFYTILEWNQDKSAEFYYFAHLIWSGRS